MILKKTMAVLAALAGMALTANAALSSPTAVFSSTASPYYYRIPALACMPNGNLVAIADDRGNDEGDISSHTIKLVSKVSSDNGKTWSAASTVGTFNGTTPSYGDAAIAVDKFSKKLICLFAAEQDYNADTAGKIYMTASEDGKKWDVALDITEQIKRQLPSTYTYKGGFVASGNMLYVHDDHQGSIYAVVTAKVEVPVLTWFEEKQLAFVIKSSDVDRKEWTVMNPNANGNPVYRDGNESKLAHLADGSLVMSVRTTGAQRYYISTDEGANWSSLSTGMTQPGANGDLMSINYNAKNYLLQSYPNSSSAFEKVSIAYSADNGASWTFGKEICIGASRYSSLTRLWDGTIGVLVEEIDGNGYHINFYTLEMTDLLPEQTIKDEYDGTLVCNGKGYMTVPSSSAFNVVKSGTKTITCRVLLNDFTYSTDKDFGVLSTRWHFRDYAKYKYFSGYEIIAGKNEEESIGANVTTDNTSYTDTRRSLNNGYFSAIMPSRWAHVAMVFDFAVGNVKIYVDGVLKETQSYEVKGTNDAPTGAVARGASITTTGSVGNNSIARDLLIGTRYDFEVESQGVLGTRYGCTPSTTKIFNSNIDDVRIYDEALSAEDVMNDKRSGFPIRTKAEGLLAAYDFADQNNEFANGKFNDISGNNHQGTLAVTNGYTFPEIGHNINVTPIKPAEAEGTLKVTRFNDGDEIVLPNGEAYVGTLNQDYKATAEPNSGWVLVSINVNGTPVPNNGFFKAGEESEVEAIFRRLADLEFYLVGDVLDSKANQSYKFDYNAEEDCYYLTLNGNIEGLFNVIGVDSANKDNVLLDLHAYETANEYGNKTMISGTAHDLENDADGTPFSVYEKGDVGQGHYITNPTFKLVYTGTEKTLTLHNYTYSEVSNIAVDANSAATEYFNLQGMRVDFDNAAPGVYIRRQGNTATKVIKK